MEGQANNNRIGAVVLATDQGLGYLAKDFYDNGLIDKVYIQPHSTRKNHFDWYKEQDKVKNIDGLLDCDAILMFETPFDWTIIPKARAKKVKTALMPMYECTPYPLRYVPDIILTPSDLDQQYYPQGIRVNVPVPSGITWKLRKKTQVFIHNAGNGGLGGRNGTQELIEAMRYVKSPIKLKIRSQFNKFMCNDPRVEIVKAQIPFKELYDDGDVFIFPEKFNGLSLPIQEAYASGMPIMCGDRFPMNAWLPNELLIPVKEYKQEQIMTKFDSAVISPVDIADTIDRWYNQDISTFSEQGLKWSKENSWEALLPVYKKILYE